MAGNRFSFVTYSDDNNGCVVKSDDQKNKKADGSGVVDGKLIFTCPVEFRKEVTGITAGGGNILTGSIANGGTILCRVDTHVQIVNTLCQHER